MEFKARASKAGSLMVGGSDFTKDDAAKLEEYQLRQTTSFVSGSGRKLGPVKNMDALMAALIEKKEKGFHLGATGISYIKEQWRFDRYGFRRVLVTKELLKGQMCEQDTMELTQSVLGGRQFRLKCKQRKETNLLTGHCDIDMNLEDLIEDSKTCWDLESFHNIESPPELYKAQGQVYMDLYGRSKFRLVYGLVPTPEVLIEKELRKYLFMFGGDADNPHYQEIEEQVYWNHRDGVLAIPEYDRIKYFEFDRDDEYIKELKRRVVVGQGIYNSLQLTDNRLLAAA